MPRSVQLCLEFVVAGFVVDDGHQMAIKTDNLATGGRHYTNVTSDTLQGCLTPLKFHLKYPDLSVSLGILYAANGEEHARI